MKLFPCGKLACNYFMGFLFHYGFLAVTRVLFLELMLFFPALPDGFTPSRLSQGFDHWPAITPATATPIA
jgi:hypothetical protein